MSLGDADQANQKFIALQTTIIVVMALANLVVMSLFGYFFHQKLSTTPADVLAEVHHAVSDVNNKIGTTMNAITMPRLEKVEKRWLTMRRAFNNSADAWALLDRHGDIELWSDGAEKLTGLARKDMVGFDLSQVLPDDLQQQHHGMYLESMRDPTAPPTKRHIDCDIITADASRVPVRIEVWISPGVCGIASFTVHEKTDEP